MTKEEVLMRTLLQLLYSFAKQYIAFYEKEIKNVV